MRFWTLPCPEHDNQPTAVDDETSSGLLFISSNPPMAVAISFPSPLVCHFWHLLVFFPVDLVRRNSIGKGREARHRHRTPAYTIDIHYFFY